MRWVLKKRGVPRKVYEVDGTVTSVRTSGGITSEFPITIGLHQGSTLSTMPLH